MPEADPYNPGRVRPKKGLGQNFLVDPVYRARIVAAAELERDDAVLEVGPGRGELTELIAAQAGQVVAVELDDRLIEPLRGRFAGLGGVSVLHADILTQQPGPLMTASGASHYKVIANLPYYITGAVIRHLLESDPPPSLLVLTVQSEVADRIVARPPKMSLLALSVQFYCDAHIVGRIPAGAFYPVPKVDSAVVRMRRRTPPEVRDISHEAFFRVARAGFRQPRKKIRNSLAAGLGAPIDQVIAWLEAAGVHPDRRAETLTVEEWGALVNVVGAGSEVRSG